MNDERRGDDARIADIQRVVHKIVEDYHGLSNRVSLIESRVSSHEREIDQRLAMIHEDVRGVAKMLADHTMVEDQDRKDLIKQQRQVMLWLAGLLVTAAGGVIMMLLAGVQA